MSEQGALISAGISDIAVMLVNAANSIRDAAVESRWRLLIGSRGRIYATPDEFLLAADIDGSIEARLTRAKGLLMAKDGGVCDGVALATITGLLPFIIFGAFTFLLRSCFGGDSIT